MHIFSLPEKWHSHVSISFTYYVSCRPRHTHTHAILFLFTFLSFLEVLVKNPKNIEKTKKKQNCKTHVGTSWWVRVCNFVFVYFFVISWGFGQKPKKHWENQKKQNCKTHVGTSWWVRVCNFFLFFLDFSRFLILLVKNPNNIEKTKKNKIARPM